MWCWSRLLRVPGTARRSNQSILKKISPGISLEEMMLKLKLQYFGHLMRRVDSLEKTLMLGGIGGWREGDDQWWDGWMASLTRWTWVWVNSGSWLWIGKPGVLRFMGSQRVGHDWATELNWKSYLEQPCWFYFSRSYLLIFLNSILVKYLPILPCTVLPQMAEAERHAPKSLGPLCPHSQETLVQDTAIKAFS